MAKYGRTVNSSFVIDGKEFPVLAWTATLASQGTMGTASAEGLLSDLIDNNLDLIEASQDANGASLDIYAGFGDNKERVFSGVVDECNLNFDDNTFTVRGRDHSASFKDGKRTLANLNTKNQKISEIVKQIADKFGFKSDITDPGLMAGVKMNGQYNFAPEPQHYWKTLQTLAMNVGYECYMKDGNTLYFGPPKEQGNITVNYGADRGSGAENPGWGLEVDYQPRNNSNITVKVMSVDTQTTKKITATAKTDEVTVGKGHRTSSSKSGSNTKSRSVAAGHSGVKAPPKTTYYIQRHGLSKEHAEKLAQGMAEQLAKRQIILSMNIEGLPSMKIHSIVTLRETGIDLMGFSGIPLNVAEVSHTFHMSEGDSNDGGYVTHFKALAQIERV